MMRSAIRKTVPLLLLMTGIGLIADGVMDRDMLVSMVGGAVIGLYEFVRQDLEM